MQNLSSPIDLIKKSILTFFEKDNLIRFLKIYIWLLPFQAFFLYQSYFIDNQSKLLNTTNIQEVVFKYPWFLVLIILVNIVFLIVSFWVDITGIKTISGILSKKNKSVRETFKYTHKLLWSYSLLSVLFGSMQVVGTILLIIPGVIVSVWFGFSKFIFVNKNLGVSGSLVASKKMVSGKFWPVLGRMIVFVVFGMVFQMMFTLIPYGFGSALYQLFGALLILPYYFLYQEISG